MHKFKEAEEKESLNEKLSVLNVAKSTEHWKAATEFSNKEILQCLWEGDLQESSKHRSQALKN